MANLLCRRYWLILAITILLNLMIFFAPLEWHSWKHDLHKNTYLKILPSGELKWNDTDNPHTEITMDNNSTARFRYRETYAKELMMDCPEGHKLVGPLRVDLDLAEETYASLSNFSLDETSQNNSKYLGVPTLTVSQPTPPVPIMFEPAHCRPKFTVAIIIPFRYREPHLRCLLGHLIPILQRQLVRYSFFVVSQLGNNTFNKGRLMNTGFKYASEAGKLSGTPFDCFIFQDVDLLVEHDTLRYGCTGGNVVDHLSKSINKFDYKPLCCGMTVGGVLAFPEDKFRQVNGYPNVYWGWGGEDDDINARIKHQKIKIQRPDNTLGRFTMIKHDADPGNAWTKEVGQRLRTAGGRFETDGLSNLDTKIVEVAWLPLYVNITVDVGIQS